MGKSGARREVIKIAFQGERGAYSEAAAIAHYGLDIQTLPCETFADVFQAVVEGISDRGFIPIENSLAGSIHKNFDLLLRHNLYIVAEHYHRINHCLMALPGVNMEQLREVYSHPQALAQCDSFISAMKNVRSIASTDTAGSARWIKEQGMRSAAAIASRRAAEVYGMEILAEGIEDDPANFTRFLALASKPEGSEEESKTSIVITLQHRPGALHQALGIFATRGIDLTKIESRPLVGRPWEYLFYLDFIGALNHADIKAAISELEDFCSSMRVLGSYARHNWILEIEEQEIEPGTTRD
ncbi:MAG: prephenate dehydratase [Chloroflexi bacterium]|nr:prephenate dehydratase [Chloroflexota bacterium]